MKSQQFKIEEMKKKNHLASKLWITADFLHFMPVATPQPASGQTNKTTQCNATVTAIEQFICRTFYKAHCESTAVPFESVLWLSMLSHTVRFFFFAKQVALKPKGVGGIHREIFSTKG